MYLVLRVQRLILLFDFKHTWIYSMKSIGSSQTFPRINTPTFSNLVILHTYSPMKMEQRECSETSAYKI